MEMAILSSIKQMAITFERHNSRNQSSTEPYIYFQQKKSGWIPTTATCAVQLHKTDSRVWETITKFIELTKSNDYFNEKRLEQNEYWMLEAINEQLKGNFITIPKYKTCWNQLKAVQNGEISPFAAAQLILVKNKPSCYVI
jgi:LAO/AO transport system kinase